MICSRCGEWKGLLASLNKAECGECGAKNCKASEPQEEDCDPGYAEGDTCNRDGCDGVIELNEPEGCLCHINPPCSACENAGSSCPKCGWDERED